MRLAAAGFLLLAACSGGKPPPTTPPSPATTAPPPETPPAPPPGEAPPSKATVVPVVDWRLPERASKTPFPVSSTPDLEAVRAMLRDVVTKYGRDPDNPWAVSHAILALGPDITLTNGRPAIDFLFSHYAEEVKVGDDTLVRFPKSRGDIRIEPHTDLILKSLAEVGVKPDRAVVVDGHPHTIGDLYRESLARTWVDGDDLSAVDWNDTPWTLQGLATWAPPDLAWVSDGHRMTMDALTHGVVHKLSDECAFIREALAQGRTFEKRGQGIFRYTCGGAHLYQGAAYAVARGFGSDADRKSVQAQIPGLFARLGVELTQVDTALQQHPDYTVILLVQRLKFLGHWVETMHKMAAMGLFKPDRAQQAAMARAVAQLIKTVQVIDKAGLYGRMEQIRKADEQVYLDLVGDSAHALHGLDLATGREAVRY